MRRLNEATEDLPMPAYKKRVKALGKHVLVQRKREEDPIGFTVPTWLRRTSVRMNKKLAESGVRVVGDLTELEPVDVPGVDPAGVPVEQELEAAVSALATVLRDGKPTWARKALRQAQKRAQKQAQQNAQQ
jgi:hypothetical protein